MSREELVEALEGLPHAPLDIGRVERVVVRPEKGSREVVLSARLTPEGGMEGDRWGQRVHKSRKRQLSAIRADVLDALARGADPSLSGDNLHLTLDLGTTNLPIGSRLRVGEALVEVTPEPHAPCGLFAGRFGQDAHDIILDPRFFTMRLRGVLLEVVEGGWVREGDIVRVEQRIP